MRIGARLHKVLQSLDIFGQPISLYIKGNTVYRTSFGGLITTLIFIIICSVTTNSFISLINKTNMKSSQQTTYESNPPFLDFTHQNFMFSIGTTANDITLNNSIVSFTATMFSVTKQNTTFSSIALRPCRADDYGNLNEYNQDFSNYLCPDNVSYGIFGSDASSTRKFISLSVDQCINGTNPYITCASSDFITKYISSSNYIPIRLYFMNRVVDLPNQQNPFKTYIDSQFWGLNPISQLLYNTDLYLRLNQISSQDDIFGISDPNIYSFISYEKERSDNVLFPTTKTPSIAKFRLLPSNYRNYYTRSYDDFLSVISYLGGILNLLTILAGFVVSIFNSYKYKMKMLNKLYDFDLKEYTNKKKYKFWKYTPDESHFFSNKVHIYPEVEKSPITGKFNIMKNLRGQLVFTLTDFCQYIFICCKSKLTKIKMILFHLADDRLAKDMDIIWIMKRLRDIDKLKTILLYPDKLELFEFISPPLISASNSKNNQNDIIAKEKSIQTLSLSNYKKIGQKLEEYYKNSDIYTHLKNENDLISQNIIKSLNPEVIEIFDCIEETKKIQKIDQINEKFDEFSNLKSSPLNIFISDNVNQSENIIVRETNFFTPMTIDNSSKKNNLLIKNQIEKQKVHAPTLNCSEKFDQNNEEKVKQVNCETIWHEIQNQKLDNQNSFMVLSSYR